MIIPSEIIRNKRDGKTLTPDQITQFLTAYVQDEIPDYQVAALLMAIYYQGLDPHETAQWTRTMMTSGRTYTHNTNKPIIDKHSTGGVGDKVSLILAPLAAACGLAVPMVCGRGLGHTGGTLDKLESIPGFNINITPQQFTSQVNTLGVAIIGQSDDFVPADKRLYALRDVTATVESIPLITSSILSKKAASGTRGLVMDVKCGTGAFMSDINQARDLAQALVNTGKALDLPVHALITNMNQPLGNTIGNALEVKESLDCLKGNGPADLREIILQLVAQMLILGNTTTDHDTALNTATQNLDNGNALNIFRKILEAQNGDPNIIDTPDILPGDTSEATLTAPEDGYLNITNCRDIGIASLALGAGRRKTTDPIDPAVGITLHKKHTDPITKNEPLATIHYRHQNQLEECQQILKTTLTTTQTPPTPIPLIIEKIT